jgi:hypothetical protein
VLGISKGSGEMLIPKPRNLPPVEDMTPIQLAEEAERLAINFADAEYLSPILKRLAEVVRCLTAQN